LDLDLREDQPMAAFQFIVGFPVNLSRAPTFHSDDDEEGGGDEYSRPDHFQAGRSSMRRLVEIIERIRNKESNGNSSK
jgi:hypothetical protein